MSHFSLSLLAIALLLYLLGTRENRRNTWWGVIGILIISVAIATLKDSILTGLLWLLPPHLSLEMMSVGDQIEVIPNVFIGNTHGL